MLLMLRWTLLGLWGAVLFVFTCNDQLTGLLLHQQIDFSWDAHPHFQDLLITSDAHVRNPFWLLIKSGHFMGFFIFDALCQLTFRNKKAAFVTTLLYAITTELLQLFFHRDGRLLDMGIDTAGALCFLFLTAWLSNPTQSQSRSHPV